LCSATRARIGGVTQVIGVRTGRIDFDAQLWGTLLENAAKHAFRRRRSADVAHADEQDSPRSDLLRGRRVANESRRDAFQLFQDTFHVEVNWSV
jgi:hypothetical protein